MKRIGQNLTILWQDDLAEKLNRSAEQIVSKGLSAEDFKGSRKVILSIPNELECTFHHAFSLVNPEVGKLAVFTEHAGYHEFYLNGMKVSESVTEEYWDEDYQV